MSKPSLKPLVIIGGGGHASVLVDVLRAQKREILAVVSPESLNERSVFRGFDHHSSNDDVLKYEAGEILLVNGIGALPNSGLKRKLNQYYLSFGYQFETVIADSAQVSPYTEIESGVQILSGAIVHAGTKIMSHTIINSGAIVEHDCDVGEYNHIAPRSLLCGQVSTGEGVFIGAGATVIQNIILESNTVVGAGAIVTQHLLTNETCYPSFSAIKRKK